MLVLYLSNRHIRAVRGSSSNGRIRVKGLYAAEDTQGCILNGNVTDEDAFVALMSDFWRKHNLPKKNVYLVLDSSQFTTRTTEVPVQKRSQMLEYVAREFSGMERMEDPVYGFFPLPGRKDTSRRLRSVFAMATSGGYLKRYRELFAGIGVRLAAIEPDLGVLLRLLEVLPQMKHETGIVQLVDQMTILNALLVDGRPVYTSRRRLYSDPGTTGYPVEAARAVSSILQFARAQGIRDGIYKIALSGLDEEDLVVYNDSIVQIDPQLVSEEFSFGGAVELSDGDASRLRVPGMALAVGALLKTDERTNVLRRVNVDRERRENTRRAVGVAVPLAAAALVLGIAAGALAYRAQGLSRELRALEAYNDDPAVLEACQKYEEVSGEVVELRNLEDSLMRLDATVRSYPLVDSALEQTVQTCAQGLVTADVSGYDSSKGVLQFAAQADEVAAIHRFVALLGEQEAFAEVDYTGYHQDAAGKWHMQVSCTLKKGQEETE